MNGAVYQVNPHLFINVFDISSISSSLPPHGRPDGSSWCLSMKNGDHYAITPTEATALASYIGFFAADQVQPQQPVKQ